MKIYVRYMKNISRLESLARGKAQENRITYVILKGTESERMEQSRCVCLWA